jgi:hypothetical protein
MTDALRVEEAPEQPAPLPYPRDFFGIDTGNSPPDETAAALLWRWRRDRPPWNAVDTQPADGAAMLREISAMRERLRKSVLRQFMDNARRVARELDLTMICGNRPVTPKDLKSALSALENSPMNHQLAYQICHEFHRKRTWLANAIDNWFLEENMSLLPDANPANQRHYESSRGGFGHVARQAKAQALAKLMQPMFQKMGWYIATTNNSRTSDKLKYEETVYYDDNNDNFNFYVVTKNPETFIVSGGNESSFNDTELWNEDDEDDVRQVVEVNSFDFPAMASILTQHFGITATPFALKSAFKQTASTQANLTGRTMLVVQNDESMTTMTSVDNNCSITIRNTAMGETVLNHRSIVEDMTSLREASENESENIINEPTSFNLDDNEDITYSTVQQREMPPLSVTAPQPPTLHETTDTVLPPSSLTTQHSTTIQPPAAEPPSTLWGQNNNMPSETETETPPSFLNTQHSTTIQPRTEPPLNLCRPNNNTPFSPSTTPPPPTGQPQTDLPEGIENAVTNVSMIYVIGFCCNHRENSRRFMLQFYRKLKRKREKKRYLLPQLQHPIMLM